MQPSLLLCVLLASATTTCATRVHHRPTRFKQPKNLVQAPVPKTVQGRAATGKIQMAYFTNWGIYGRNFQPSDIDIPSLTHILYSFADTNPSTGELVLSDTYADLEKRYPTDSWNDIGNNLYGCFKQLYLLKMKQRNLKVLLSVGGWTYSQNGHFSFVNDATKRANFITSAVRMVENFALDGIDVDFEYPTAGQKAGFTALMAGLRAALDDLAARKGDRVPYLVTAALPAGISTAANFDVPALAKLLDFFNLMTYDFSGSWSPVTGDLANLYDNGLPSQDSTGDVAVKWWVARGAPANKIVLGLPLYGRGFENTLGRGRPFAGIGQGTWESGVYDYSVLPFAGATVFENSTSVASWSFDATKKQFISFDTPNIAKTKAQYAVRNGLAGAMYWELSGDKKGTANLVRTVGSVFGALDQSPNHIAYPGSKYDNVRNYMGLAPGNGSATPTSSPSVIVTPTSTSRSTPALTTTSHPTAPTGCPACSCPSTPTITPSPATGNCTGLPAYSAGAVYIGGQSVSYGGRKWTAAWWTQGETPSTGGSNVWRDGGAC
ncbi:glycoside hydrolase family 18 and carbohydrate-binding module family 5 protein [Auricularia subglabra TFB-10046 SS5]|nr:glycoside hydrolase family 18 and carbohydrate-binding module family 5 protein [Auricularia subglabra TFB-10046 SS5]